MPSLLDLPPELRLEIYEYYLANTTLQHQKFAGQDNVFKCACYVKEPAILSVCRLVREEALSAYIQRLEAQIGESQERLEDLHLSFEQVEAMQFWAGQRERIFESERLEALQAETARVVGLLMKGKERN